ncbi:Tn3 family transposase [Streptomyces albidochromogenes]|uniref:Tn3 family transposase n=1 Tax=Streptomyces albidochromogenes TaxID=329524 RepID=UPI003F6DC34A
MCGWSTPHRSVAVAPVSTLHLLQFVSDEGYRRMIGAQLNVTEARHRLARKIFFGQRGELRQHYREVMEDQLGALGLTLSAEGAARNSHRG